MSISNEPSPAEGAAPSGELPDLSTLTEQLEQSLFAVRTSVDVFIDEEDLAPTDTPDDDSCPWNDAFPDWEGPILPIVDWKETERAYANRIARSAFQDSRRLTTLMEQLRARGSYRKLACIPPDWRDQLEALEAQFPNFGDVVDYLRGAYALAACGDRVPRLSPLLLNGPPGIGKSLFADRFARHLGSGIVTLRMETAQSNSGLSGSAEYWGNTKAGAVCNTLLEKDFGNPVFFLDEIDKAATGEHDPLMSLYALLEPTTARAFSDLSYPWLVLDASRIIWVCTANDADALPEPLLDRLRRFDIDQPTLQQTRRMVHAIFAGLLAEMPAAAASLRLAPHAVTMLASLSPRRIRQVLSEAIGQAVYEGRSRILERDIPVATESAPKPRVGFLP